MEIRTIKITEYSQVENLHKVIFNEDNKNFFENLKNKDYYKTYVCTQKELVVAYCIITEIADQSELINIAVSPEYKRQGIGYKLLKYALQNMQNNILFLEVSHKNIPAINLYKKLDFKEIGKRKNYYGDSDAILMQYLKS